VNIAIIVESYHAGGGVERRTHELVKGLRSSGHEVEVYANRWDPDLVQGVRMHRIPIFKLSRPLRPLSFSWFCYLATARSRHDLIHTQARVARYDVATLGVGCHRAYLDALGIDPARAPDGRLHRAILRIEQAMLRPGRYRRLITNSNMCRLELMKYYGVPAEGIVVVHNGVDSDTFSPQRTSELRDEVRRELGLSPDEIAVLYVGAGFRRKGLDTLIEAAARMDGRQQVRILIAGKGRRDEYERLAGSCGIGGRLLWTGQSADIVRRYAAADIFALPTRYDPFANSTLEALACGLPVVTTRTNGVSEILSDGTDAFVIEPNAPEMLADRLQSLAGDPDLRRRIGSAGRTAVEPYTWEKTTAETVRVYNDILRARKAG
jgi:UDP-glucose:(heptosyl)LPS alpha-1,3-glucosyltransferase